MNALTSDNEVGLRYAQALSCRPQNGVRCRVGGCLFAAKMRDTVVKHAMDVHADVVEAKELILGKISYQMLFYQDSPTYYVVTVPDVAIAAGDQNLKASTDDGVDALQRKSN